MINLIKYLILYPLASMILLYTVWMFFWIMVGIIVYIVRDTNEKSKN